MSKESMLRKQIRQDRRSGKSESEIAKKRHVRRETVSRREKAADLEPRKSGRLESPKTKKARKLLLAGMTPAEAVKALREKGIQINDTQVRKLAYRMEKEGIEITWTNYSERRPHARLRNE